jgi:phosphatidylglycerophosphatase A
MKRLAVLIASSGGLGYAPVAPGTVGSAVGVVIYLATRAWPLGWQCALVAAVCVVGTWAAHVTAAHVERDDPSLVIVDEVAGQLVTLLATGVTLTGALLGFFLFRLLDIIKPWPANRLERLHGGVGIMADDVAAAVYGNLILQVAVRLLPGRL